MARKLKPMHPGDIRKQAEGGLTGAQEERVPNSGKTISRRKALRALDRLHGEALS